MYASGELAELIAKYGGEPDEFLTPTPEMSKARAGGRPPGRLGRPGADVMKVEWGDYASDLVIALWRTMEYTVLGFVGAVLLGLVAGPDAAESQAGRADPGGDLHRAVQATSRCSPSSSSPTSALPRSECCSTRLWRARSAW